VSLFDQYPPKITPDTATLHSQSEKFIYVIMDDLIGLNVISLGIRPGLASIEGGNVTSRVSRLANPQGHLH
jgi:hypothetical protein